MNVAIALGRAVAHMTDAELAELVRLVPDAELAELVRESDRLRRFVLGVILEQISEAGEPKPKPKPRVRQQVEGG